MDFRKIKLNQIQNLIDILRLAVEKDIEFVRQQYNYAGTNFDETYSFLEAVGFVETKNNIVNLNRDIKKELNEGGMLPETVNKYLLKELLKKGGVYFYEVNNYLNKFKFVNEKYIYKPLTKERLKEGGIRNLFIELDFVSFKIWNQTYYINQEYTYKFIRYLEITIMSPEVLEYIKKKQLEIGLLAEKEIVNYEKNRLKNHPDLIEMIEHVSLEDTNVGYDIKSFEGPSKDSDKPLIRFIEVKAVSLVDYKFFWSRNEIKTSKRLGAQYYLYLLPAVSDKKFDIKNQKIFQNPYEYFFTNDNAWNRQEELFSFWNQPNEEE